MSHFPVVTSVSQNWYRAVVKARDSCAAGGLRSHLNLRVFNKNKNNSVFVDRCDIKKV